MLMQWFVNEMRTWKADIESRLTAAIEGWAQKQVEAAERITKLEGELKAMKARMGKPKE